MTLPRTPPIGNLVGYGGDDDDDDEDDSDPFSGAPHPPKRRLSVSSGDNANGPLAAPRLSHRRIGSQAQPFQPLPSPDDEDEDEEDTLLESLVTGPAIKLSSAPSTPPATKSAISLSTGPPELGPMRMGEKRRRVSDDDDDEWMLERLASKAKRISNAVGNSGESTEGGPKKIKLILNKLGSTLSTSSQTPTSGSDGG